MKQYTTTDEIISAYIRVIPEHIRDRFESYPAGTVKPGSYPFVQMAEQITEYKSFLMHLDSEWKRLDGGES